MREYVVRGEDKGYVHAFSTGTRWADTACYAQVKDIQWTALQRLAFRWTDRNGAASVAKDLHGYVVRLVPKRKAACDFEHPHPEHPCGRRTSEST